MTTGKSWDSLSTPIDASLTFSEILTYADANYSVELSPVLVHDSIQDNIVTIDKRYVTCRVNPNKSAYDYWEVVKDRYEIVQNADILERASNVVERSGGSAFLHSCGVLDEGRKFFVVISTGGINIEVNGAEDHIDSYVVVMTSHDGSIPICYYNLDVRRLNKVVYRIYSSDYDFSIRKRHTPNESGDSHEEAADALLLRSDWSNVVRSALSAFLTPISTNRFDSVIEKFWSMSSASTEKQRDHAESVRNTIHELYNKSHNSGMFGFSKWAALNAITEYIDFNRNIDPLEAAQHSLEIDNYSHRLKLSVFKELSSH